MFLLHKFINLIKKIEKQITESYATYTTGLTFLHIFVLRNELNIYEEYEESAIYVSGNVGIIILPV